MNNLTFYLFRIESQREKYACPSIMKNRTQEATWNIKTNYKNVNFFSIRFSKTEKANKIQVQNVWGIQQAKNSIANIV